jgi:hypothetical protein
VRIWTIECPLCKDLIYSRANHDFHSCTCGNITVDGGPNSKYGRHSCAKGIPKAVEIWIDATKKELYDDWNMNEDKYGVVKHGKLPAIKYGKQKTVSSGVESKKS